MIEAVDLFDLLLVSLLLLLAGAVGLLVGAACSPSPAGLAVSSSAGALVVGLVGGATAYHGSEGLDEREAAAVGVLLSLVWVGAAVAGFLLLAPVLR